MATPNHGRSCRASRGRPPHRRRPGPTPAGERTRSRGAGSESVMGSSFQLVDASRFPGSAHHAPVRPVPGRAPGDRRRWPCRPARRRHRRPAARPRPRRCAPRRRRRSAASGRAGPAFVDGPHRHRVDRRSRQPPSPATEAGRAGRRVDGHTHDGVDQGERSAPASTASAARAGRSVTFGLSFAQSGRAPPRPSSRGPDRVAHAARAVGEHPPAVLDVGAGDVGLDRDDGPGGDEPGAGSRMASAIDRAA